MHHKTILVSVIAILLSGCNQTVQNKNEHSRLDTQNTTVDLSSNNRDNPSDRLKSMSKIAVLEKEKPEHPSGMVASLVGHLQIRENCIVVIAEGGILNNLYFPPIASVGMSLPIL